MLDINTSNISTVAWIPILDQKPTFSQWFIIVNYLPVHHKPLISTPTSVAALEFSSQIYQAAAEYRKNAEIKAPFDENPWRWHQKLSSLETVRI